MDEIGPPKPVRHRRRHSAEFKARVVAACQEPGVSVARVALEHGLNDNMVRRWIKVASPGSVTTRPDFVPLALPAPAIAAPAVAAEDMIRIEVPRTGGAITITWPTSQADRAVSLLRELLL